MGMSRRLVEMAGEGCIRAGFVVAVCLASTTAAAAQSYVAGSAPDRRPEQAPRIQAVKHDARWLNAAAAGVSKPHPAVCGSLKDQGDWYTPFTNVGVPESATSASFIEIDGRVGQVRCTVTGPHRRSAVRLAAFRRPAPVQRVNSAPADASN